MKTKSGYENVSEKALPEGVYYWGFFKMLEMIHLDQQK